MIGIFDSVVDNVSGYFLCFYINSTSQIQLIKINNIPNYYWERAIFPGQRLMFEATTLALLEIHTSESVTAFPADVIPCQQLRVIDESTSAKHYPLTENEVWACRLRV